MPSKLHACWILLILALAGCGSEEPKPPAQEGSQSQSASETSTTSETREPEKPPLTNTTNGRIELTQCVGFYSGTNSYPRALTPGEVPPGWEEDPTNQESFMTMAGYDCNRINVGPYERGPVRIVWDAHGKGTIPEQCTANESAGNTHRAIFGVFLVNDADIASYLATVFGMPALFAEINTQANSTGPITLHDWSWNTPGQASSKFTLLDDGTRASTDVADRLFWQRATGLGQLDITYDRQGVAYTNRYGFGPMAPPMLLAETPQNNYAAFTDYYDPMTGTGTVRLYSDYLCEKPEPLP